MALGLQNVPTSSFFFVSTLMRGLLSAAQRSRKSVMCRNCWSWFGCGDCPRSLLNFASDGLPVSCGRRGRGLRRGGAAAGGLARPDPAAGIDPETGELIEKAPRRR